MDRRNIPFLCFLFFSILGKLQNADSVSASPNIVIILADDVAGVLEMPDDYYAVKEVEKTYKRMIKKRGTPWLVGLMVLFAGFIYFKRKRQLV